MLVPIISEALCPPPCSSQSTNQMLYCIVDVDSTEEIYRVFHLTGFNWLSVNMLQVAKFSSKKWKQRFVTEKIQSFNFSFYFWGETSFETPCIRLTLIFQTYNCFTFCSVELSLTFSLTLCVFILSDEFIILTWHASNNLTIFFLNSNVLFP